LYCLYKVNCTESSLSTSILCRNYTKSPQSDPDLNSSTAARGGDEIVGDENVDAARRRDPEQRLRPVRRRNAARLRRNGGSRIGVSVKEKRIDQSYLLASPVSN